jgi:hypothetical protein
VLERRIRHPAPASGEQLIQVHDRTHPAPAAGDHPVLHRDARNGPRAGRDAAAAQRRDQLDRAQLLAERAKDIAAEYRYQYGGLLGLFDAFRGRGETFGRDDIEFLCLELTTGEIPTTGTSSWLADRDPADVIEILWQVGFLTAEPPARPGRRATAPGPSWARIRSSI